MNKQFEIIVAELNLAITADLLEAEAPITCECFWQGIAKPWQQKLHHGREIGAELWCLINPPARELPYENSTVFPQAGEILYYHYFQLPPSAEGWLFDIGIYYSRGCSKIRQGWMPGNLFARLSSPQEIRKLEQVAAALLQGGSGLDYHLDVTLRRKTGGVPRPD